MSENLIQPSPNAVIKIQNRNCAYCGNELTDAVATEEHVIGRRFVPKNTLFGQWNVIVRACSKCNNAKSALEDDISAITMQPDGFGVFASEDGRLKAEAARKERSQSRHTGKPVAESAVQLNLSGHLGSDATLSIAMSGPPQVSDERSFQLAYYHVQGFFFLITFDEANQRGGFFKGVFRPVMATRRADWGNAKMRAFASTKASWKVRCEGIAANEYFKVSIRRHLADAEVWAWALEWNQNFRVIGFFGNEEDVEKELAALPHLVMKEIGREGNAVYRIRHDIPLPTEDDIMFSVKTEPETLASS